MTVDGEGSYLYDVRAEEDRAPDARQEDEIRSTAFSDWYQAKKDAVTIDRDPAITGFGA